MVSAAITFTVSGLHGWLYVIAAVLFFVSAIIAWFVTPRSYWPTFVALGLVLVALGYVITS